MKPEVGTLAEIGAKVGDVVECLDNGEAFIAYTIGEKYTVGEGDNRGINVCEGEDYGSFRILPLAQPQQDVLLKNIQQAEEWADKQMTRASILDDAKQAVTQDRQDTHGKPEDTFALIAAYWSAHLGISITGVDVAAMMSLLKLARAKQNPMHADNWVDLAGYAACAGELANG